LLYIYYYNVLTIKGIHQCPKSFCLLKYQRNIILKQDCEVFSSEATIMAKMGNFRQFLKTSSDWKSFFITSTS